MASTTSSIEKSLLLVAIKKHVKATILNKENIDKVYISFRKNSFLSFLPKKLMGWLKNYFLVIKYTNGTCKKIKIRYCEKEAYKKDITAFNFYLKSEIQQKLFKETKSSTTIS